MLKFLLLEWQQIALTELPVLLRERRLFATINERFLQKTEEELAQWLVSELVRVGVAETADGMLLNRG